ncbi:PTS sugar transporter subunit IIA [Anaerobacillus alkalilacustris]|uniref:PTS sugar transporter subunit IIA n=1 Tax=Anaerobacillus alkalilacustris TaxID=393763 RepID=A0A1S2LLD0_9BACI|nr:PTS transporter subunit IIABC [Anaerobacillus alkalilacustris]OIJ12477.1 PTS sugar transporter subunit IIA [Anaerobacillus alkalilacustris]
MKIDFSSLQKFGKALMVPVALLPAAGILLGIGAALTGPLAQNVQFLQNPVVAQISAGMLQVGISLFVNLPIIFALGIAIGLTGGSGIAALAALLGYLIMNTTISFVLGITPEMAATSGEYGMALGIPTLETGVLGGIVVGFLAVYMYRRFHKFQPPEMLGFFAGDRSVGIFMVFASIILAFAMMIIWPPIQSGINAVANIIATDATNPAYVGLYGALERLLIPTGLHHIWYAPFLWTGLGGTTEVAGQLVSGDQYIFLAQIAAGVEVTAGRFMAGKFPIIMFGLLGAALAMYKRADADKKPVVKGMLIAAAGTAFLTGITEPIEFTFLFVAPFLYVFHSLLTGISYALTYMLDVHLGWAGGSGFIDYILVNVLPGTPNWWMNIVLGAIFFAVYYFSFSFVIKKWDIATPGRGGQEVKLFTRKDYNAKKDGSKSTKQEKNREIALHTIVALGGPDNLVHVDACFTRLRVEVRKIELVDENLLKQLGAAGVVKIKNNIQAIFGGNSDLYKNEINELLQSPDLQEELNQLTEEVASTTEIQEEVKQKSSFQADEIAIPIKGKLLPITDVPDAVFSEKMMGDGFAIEPKDGTIVSPVKGKILNIFPTKHAIGIQSDSGLELLIHVGLDTVKLDGKGFELLVEEGQEVKQGQELLKVDLDYIKEHATSTVTPIVFMNLNENQMVVVEQSGFVEINEKDKISIKDVEQKGS